MSDPRRILRATLTADGKLDSLAADPQQIRAELEAGQIDELHLTIRPHLDGRRNAATLSGPPGAPFFFASIRCRLIGTEIRNDECHLRYRVLQPRRRRSLSLPSSVSSVTSV